MQRLLIDMDGVLADVYFQFKKYHKEEFGVVPAEEHINGKNERDAFEKAREYVNTRNFFLEAPVMTDSVTVLQQLNEQYELFIVSAAMEFPLSLYEKQQWLNTHFPFLEWTQIVLCGSKKVVHGDIMIDDHFKNLDYFNGRTILYTQPHNMFKETGKHQRVENWKEIGALLLPN